MNKKLNVLFIASWYPGKNSLSNGDFIQRHAHAVSLYANVIVINIQSYKQKENYILEEKIEKELHEYRVYYKKVKSKSSIISYIQNFYRKRKSFKIAYQQILEVYKSIDIVHLNVFYPAAIFALYLKRKYKIPFIVTEHWTIFLPSSKYKFNFIQLYLIRKTAKQASQICPVSYDLKKALLTHKIQGKYSVIPNVVDTKYFYPDYTKKNQELIKILHVSHMLNEHKNIIGILNAMKTVFKLASNIEISFIGKNDIDEYLKYIEKINLPTDRISFGGEMSNEDVANNLRKHDIFLLFSNYENLPCVISEAHVCGLPVISSNVGGISEIISPENGILVNSKDEEALAKAILHMSTKLQDYNKVSIAETAHQRYNYQSVGFQYFSLYKKILKIDNV